MGWDSSVGIATRYGLGWCGDRIPLGGARLSAPVHTGPGAHPASCTMGTGSFLGVKSGWGMTLTPHPLLVLWSWKSRAIPLLPQWAIWPVQSLSPCTRVHFTFFFIIVPVLYTHSYIYHRFYITLAVECNSVMHWGHYILWWITEVRSL